MSFILFHELIVDYLISRTDTISLTFRFMRLILEYAQYGRSSLHNKVDDQWMDWGQQSNPLLLDRHAPNPDKNSEFWAQCSRFDHAPVPKRWAQLFVLISN